MKILHIGKYYYPSRGGVEKVVQTLAEAQVRDHCVGVVVANQGAETRAELMNGVNVARLGTAFIFFGQPICWELFSRLKDKEYDVVHIHLPNPFAEIAYLVSRPRGRMVVTYHSDIVRQKFLFWFYQPVQRYFLSLAYRIMATSQKLIEYSPVLSRFSDKCSVVPCSIDPEEFAKGDTDHVRAVRDRFGERMILSVGRMVPYKGFEYAIKAMAHIPDAHLVIIGQGPLEKKLRRITEALDLAGRVTFLDKVENSVDYFLACQVFVLPSVMPSEAFGIVQLEAMAAGKPVVNTAIRSGVPEVSVDGVTGLTVRPRDERALAEAVNRLLGDPALRARMGEQGRQRVREFFSDDIVIRKAAAVYGLQGGKDV
jgi:rhamnosyl/mannosyltransferase